MLNPHVAMAANHDVLFVPQVACMAHFQTNPLSALAAAAGQGPAALRAAVAALPEALRGRGRSGGASSSGAATPSLAEEVEGTLHAWSAWAVALRWINAAARSVGMGNAAGWLLLPGLCATCRTPLVLALQCISSA